MAAAITPEQLQQRMETEPLTVLDVRSASEHAADGIDPDRGDTLQVHIDRFRDAPADTAALIATTVEHESVVVVCWKGSCSQTVAARLMDEGVEARYLAGGMAAWPPEGAETPATSG